MEFRRLGRSGLTISEIAYGNWLTHGSQVEEDAALACVRAALDAGITTFDTADVYAGTKAESVLGRALAGQRRSSYEMFTKVYWPTGPGQNDRGLVPQAHHRELPRLAARLQTDYVDLYQAHRYDTTVPLEETMTAFADLVRAGKVLYIGVSEWNAEQIAAGAALARELDVQLISNQPQYSMLWRVIEDEVVPTSEKEGAVPDRLVAAGPGRADRQVPAGRAAAGRQPRRARRGRPVDARLPDRRHPRRGCSSCGRSPTTSACRWRSWPSPGCCRTENVAAAIIGAHPARAGPRQRQGRRRARWTPTS